MLSSWPMESLDLDSPRAEIRRAIIATAITICAAGIGLCEMSNPLGIALGFVSGASLNNTYRCWAAYGALRSKWQRNDL